MKSIGLCLIVKNEGHIISRCLDSVKSLIDYVLICDTGSTDDTKLVILDWLSENNIRGQVIDDPWISFSHNRTSALKKMREIDVDYCLMVDADEILVFEIGFDVDKFKSLLDLDYYHIDSVLGGVTYNRPQLTSNKKDFRYEGVIHEFLAMDGGYSSGKVSGFHNQPIQDSSRNMKGVGKFIDDIKILEEEISKDIGDYMKSRYTFYLAQSYRDSGQIDLAIKNYKIRSVQGFWREEEFVSLYNIAKIKNNDPSYPKEEVVQDFMKSFEHSPHRTEPLYWVSLICRLNSWNHQGYMISKYAIDRLTPSSGGLFIENWIYDYGILDEFSILSFYIGKIDESREVCNRLLIEGKIPDYYIPRIENNIRFCG